MPDWRSRTLRIGLIAAGALLVIVVLAGLYVRNLLGPASLENILNDAIGPATNGVYVVAIEDTDVLLRQGDLTLLGVQVSADLERVAELAVDGRHPALTFGVEVNSVALDGLSLWQLIFGRNFVADSLVVDRAEVLVRVDPDPLIDATQLDDDEARDATPAAEALPPAERLQAALAGIPTVAIGRAAIEGAALRVDTVEHTEGVPLEDEPVTSSDVVGQIDVEFLDTRIDESAGIEQARRLYTDDIRLRISEVESRQLGNNVFRLGELTGSSKDQRFDVSGLAFESTATIDEYLARPDVAEGDRVNVLVNAISVTGFDFARYMANLDIFVRGIAIDGFRVDVLSDKEKPKTPRVGPAPMPHDVFQRLPVLLTIEEVQLSGGEVTYSERSGGADRPGTVTFREVSGTVSNISNNPDRMSEETPLVLVAQTRANDVAQASVEWRIPLLSPRPTMISKGTLAAFDAVELNRTVQPMLGVRFKSGRIEGVNYEFNYSPTAITGELNAAYRDLDVDLVDRNTGQENLGRKILGFLANTIAIRNNNPGRPGAGSARRGSRRADRACRTRSSS